MQSTPFTLEIRGIEYNGHLQPSDNNAPPKVFFVFIDNYIVGNLLYMNVWEFRQVAERLPKLKEEELKIISDYLGNIAVEGYELNFLN